MPFWRKKEDGFEWNKYVRTTVLVRRKKRREKLEEVGAAAVFGVRQAKWKSIANAKRAVLALGRGSRIAGRAIHSGSKAGWAYGWPRLLQFGVAVKHGSIRYFWAFVALVRAALRTMRDGTLRFSQTIALPALKTAGGALAYIAAPILKQIARPEIIGPLAIVAVIATLGALSNFITAGMTRETLFVSGLALSLIGLLVAAWPSDHNVFSKRVSLSQVLHPFQGLSRRTVGITLAVPAIVVAAAVGMWQTAGSNSPWLKIPELTMPDIIPSVDVAALNPFKSEIVEGRARVIDSGQLRVDKQRLRLDDMEALLPAQTCTNNRGRSWRCGRKAKDRLKRLVRRRTLTCTVSGTDDDGTKRAICLSKDGDIAARLIASGYAFAHLGAFATYRDEENEARKNKRGIWQGTAERPSDYRIARWDKAAKTAPDGCPIKGRVVRRKRFYALPWDRGYARAKIRPRRGEQWFCTEQEARAAGFKHSSQI